MSISLRLDPKALEALFPEGTQARLDLQQSVLNEVSKRVIKGITQQQLLTLLTPIVEEVKKEIVGELFFKDNKFFGSSLTLTTQQKDILKNFFKVQLENHINEFLRDEVQDKLDSINIKRIISEAQKELEKEVISKFNNNLCKSLEDKLKGILNTSIANIIKTSESS